MPTKGRRVYLRAISTEDYDWLYQLEASPERLPWYRHAGVSPPPERFADSLWAGVIAQFAIASRATDTPIGVVAAYRYDARNGHARLAGVLRPDFERRGWPLEGFSLFLDYVFETFPIRKLYGEVAAPNAEAFRSSFGSTCVQEGTLKGHQYMMGSYVDTHVVAIWRETWLQRASQRRERIARRSSVSP